MKKKDEINDDNLKVLHSDDDINILIEIKDIHIDNDEVRRALLYCLRGKVEELKSDMTFIKKASKIREDTGNNTQSLLTVAGALATTGKKLLKIRSKMMLELMSNPDTF